MKGLSISMISIPGLNSSDAGKLQSHQPAEEEAMAFLSANSAEVIGEFGRFSGST